MHSCYTAGKDSVNDGQNFMYNHVRTNSTKAPTTSQWCFPLPSNILHPSLNFKSFSRLFIKLDLMEAKASSLKNQIQHPFIPLCKVIMNVDRKHTSTFLVEKENSVAVFLAFGTLRSSALLVPFSWPGFTTLIPFGSLSTCLAAPSVSLSDSFPSSFLPTPMDSLCLSLGLLTWSILLYWWLQLPPIYMFISDFKICFFSRSLFWCPDSRITLLPKWLLTMYHAYWLLTLLQPWFH